MSGKKEPIPISSIFAGDVNPRVREIGEHATWSLSSCKVGFGVDQLRDNNLQSYWQSDGPQPHLINIQFHRRTAVKYISLYTDYKADESYTPNKISIRIGNDCHDLRQVELLELDEPCGWINVDVESNGQLVRTFMIQVAILANHQNGRDAHLRQVKIFGPNSSVLDPNWPSIESFNSQLMGYYSCVK